MLMNLKTRDTPADEVRVKSGNWGLSLWVAEPTHLQNPCARTGFFFAWQSSSDTRTLSWASFGQGCMPRIRFLVSKSRPAERLMRLSSLNLYIICRASGSHDVIIYLTILLLHRCIGCWGSVRTFVVFVTIVIRSESFLFRSSIFDRLD